MKLSIIVGLVGIVCATSLPAEVVSRTERSYVLQFNDGFAERWVVRYEGHANERRWQTGKHSSWKHPTDTRQCHWEFSAYVQRDACLVSRSGQQFCKGQYSRIFNLQNTGKGRHFNWKKLQGDNCGKMAGRISSEFNALKGMVSTEFNRIVSEDTPQVSNELRNLSGAINIIAK